ncbi:MAG: glycosyltransferase family 39 protein, partial [Syntrophales bacterium]|nr:glycosyltransferase family 39 protein [Syntrophales bacterium]
MKINWERMTLIFVAILTLLRLCVAPTFGLGVDEAHYFLYARFLDWSYVDHPPLVGWTHWPLYALFGTNEFLVRLPAILLFAGVSFFVYRFTYSFSESGLISFLSVVAINSSFILNAMSIMLLPDCFLLLLVFPLMDTIRKIAETGQIRYFICLGLLLGLAGLAKYTAILFVPPLLIFLLIKKRYKLIFSSGMFLAAGIALLMVSPVLYWNIQNDFISFRYQGGHVLAAASPSIKSFFVSLLTQFGAYSPFLFLIAFYGLYKGWKSTDDRIRLSVLFGVVILLFFFYSSLYERTLPHWPSLFYLLFIPIGGYYLLSAGS